MKSKSTGTVLTVPAQSMEQRVAAWNAKREQAKKVAQDAEEELDVISELRGDNLHEFVGFKWRDDDYQLWMLSHHKGHATVNLVKISLDQAVAWWADYHSLFERGIVTDDSFSAGARHKLLEMVLGNLKN